MWGYISLFTVPSGNVEINIGKESGMGVGHLECVARAGHPLPPHTHILDHIL